MTKFQIIINGEFKTIPAQPGPEPPASSLLNENAGFEDGTWANQWSPAGSNYGDWSIGVSQEQARTGNNSLKFQHSTPEGGSFNRCEATLDPPLYYHDFFKEYWLGFSLYIPEWSDVAPPEWNTCYQLHSVPNNGDWNAGYSGENGWTVGIRDYSTGTGYERIGFHANELTEAQANNDIPPNSAMGVFVWEDSPIPVGVWMDFVINWKWSYLDADNPFMKLWYQKGGTGYAKVYDRSGPNMYRLDGQGLPKEPKNQTQMGSYKQTDNTTQTTFYYDNIKLGDETADFELVDPSNPANT